MGSSPPAAVSLTDRSDPVSPKSAWVSPLPEASVSRLKPVVNLVDGVARVSVPAEIVEESSPHWKCFVVGYFMGDAPHLGTIHATVNRIWNSVGKASRIDVQFLSPKTVLFRIESEQTRARVLRRKYWHIADVPLVLNEWCPETVHEKPSLTAMPLWVDFRGVPGFLFSQKGLRFLADITGEFVRLYPNTERCTRLDMARILVEVNLEKCLNWGHKEADCSKKNTAVGAGSPHPSRSPVSQDVITVSDPLAVVAALVNDLENVSAIVEKGRQVGSELLAVNNGSVIVSDGVGIKSDCETNKSHSVLVVTENVAEPNGEVEKIEQGWSVVPHGRKSSPLCKPADRTDLHLGLASGFRVLEDTPEDGEIVETETEQSKLVEDKSTGEPENAAAILMTSIFSWNMRGFNMPRKQNPVRKWVQSQKFAVGCLLETRIQFFNHLASHPQFLEIVAQTWSSTQPLFHSRSTLTLLHKKLKSLKEHLRRLNRERYGDLPSRVQAAYEELCAKQNEALQNPQEQTYEAVTEASERWNHLASIEEQFYHHKSRVQWMQFGDQNTSYFHKTAESRAARNAIKHLKTCNGEVLTELSDTKAEAVRHYKSFLQDQQVDIEVPSVNFISQLVSFRCTSEDAARLVQPVSAEEIRETMFSMPLNKVPGPDGFTVEFFKAAWPIVGRDFVFGVQSFFLFGFMPKGINSTILTLVPKTTNPDTMKDYRPIACCRLLLENVLLATELVKDYHRPLVTTRSAIKLDIAKAFDTFLSIVSLTVFFTSSRGLRQGCSLSPYLYVIVSNVLSGLLTKTVRERHIGIHPKCQGFHLSHLSFADDILVFTDGTPQSLHGTLAVFTNFAHMSGLNINISKSYIFAAGRGKLCLEQAVVNSGLEVCELPIRYLGLPLTTKAMTRVDYEPLIDKIRNRLASWTTRYLSYAGRAQLMKSVIASITNFWSSVFTLPKKCFKEIESMFSAFLWSGSPNTNGKAKVAWEDVCVPREEGGLGIRRMHEQWRKLLKLRPLAAEFTRTEIGDGSNTYFWLDRWLPIGRLVDILGTAGSYQLGVPKFAKVSEVVNDAGWSFRRCRNRNVMEVIRGIQGLKVPSSEADMDKVLWRHYSDDFRPVYNAASTWDQLRTHAATKEWSKVIWFPQTVPRFAFITWLAIKDRLTTGSRTRAWGDIQSCLFCGEPDETRDHLFFACPYSFMVWIGVVGDLLSTDPDLDWADTLQRLITHPYARYDYILLCMCFQATIYYLWRERNERRHNSLHRTHSQLIRTIERVIRSRIVSLRYYENKKLRGLIQRWFSSRQSH
ncbi:Reverse transcriptase domain [Arabidopsis suecica]|uniref:Reverse transcriptase domain n=1 Tax=Arabidopsis suecica TaxID=45249 RepID=A0A8T1XV34_ARASU|nr:Reverse transcriptase domain [Arabidopsis suecica]